MEKESVSKIALAIKEADSVLNVLLVDDDECFLMPSKRILELDDKIKVDIAASVREAFEKLKQFHYDVVVSGYDMPGKNGLEFLEELRKTSKNLPFFLFTGNERDKLLANKALSLGALGCLSKHGDPEEVYTELRSCIKQAVGAHEARESIVKKEKGRK